jgi:superfamily II DNA or RNA helicase
MDPTDESTLERLVGSTTFARGRSYARQGAVLASHWTSDRTCLVGEVQGGDVEPYAVAVIVTSTPTGRLTDIDGACTCPVEFNCKHAVALVLADDQGPPDTKAVAPSLSLVRDGEATALLEPPSPSPGTGRGPATAGRGSRSPDWEAPLRALVDPDAAGPSEAGDGDIGLQFELVLTPPDRGSRSNAPTTGIRLRPVVRNQSQNWVRTGISWSRLDQDNAYGRQVRGGRASHLTVLSELLALSRLSNHRTYSYYSSADEAVWLQTVNSRRLWDLLAEARDVRLPMVQSGRQALPVDLRPAPAPVVIDATRPGSGLELRPRVTVDGEDVPLGSSLLIGEPAHGIAWWDAPDGFVTPPTRLALASFEAPVDDHLRGLLAFGAIAVPPEDEERFLRELYPSLRRRIVVGSSDHSVDLPELPAARLVLMVRYVEGHRVELKWSRSAAGATWMEDLWDSPSRLGDRVAEDRIVEAVTAAISSLPGLLEPTLFGDRLAPGAVLTGMAAVRFLGETLPVLEEIEGVEVENQGEFPEYREIVEAPVVELGGSSSGDNDWFDLTVTVTVDGEEVPFADLFVALAEEQTHLILPSGTFFSLDREELRQLAGLIAEARALDDHAGEGLRLSRFQASLWEDLQRLGIVTAQAREWEQSVRALTEANNRIEHAVPDLLHATLRPYQLTGFNWLAYLFEHRLGGVLADDMGLGKTIQALALMCHTWEQGLTDAAYLVVAPTSVVGNWAAECRRFAPDLNAVTITGTEKRRGIPLAELAAQADVVITSYALFRIEYDAYAGVDWAGLFLDEAQFAKNRGSQAYQRARMLPVPFKVAMTGTPIENNLMELWSLLSITAPGLFTNPDRFTDHYRNPIEKKGDTERLAQLRRRVRPLMLRRTKEQVVRDLPEKQEQVLELDLHPKQRKLYQTYLQRERQKVLGLLGDVQKNRFEIFRSLTLLRQASLDMSLVDAKHVGVPSTKLDALMEILEEVAADGHRVLVFSQFTRFLTLARRRIEEAGIQYCYLDGSTRKRDVVIDEFRSGTAPVFLISLKAGGFGLNLTEADYCIILDPWWNPATEAQAVDRLHRIGQTKKVMVYRLVAKDTLEEKVMALKARKSALFSNVMDGGDFESGAMTAADIQELLS